MKVLRAAFPSVISVAGIACIGAAIVVGDGWVGAALLCVGAAADWIDGAVARRMRTVSWTGHQIDSLGDVAVCHALLMALSPWAWAFGGPLIVLVHAHTRAVRLSGRAVLLTATMAYWIVT